KSSPREAERGDVLPAGRIVGNAPCESRDAILDGRIPGTNDISFWTRDLHHCRLLSVRRERFVVVGAKHDAAQIHPLAGAIDRLVCRNVRKVAILCSAHLDSRRLISPHKDAGKNDNEAKNHCAADEHRVPPIGQTTDRRGSAAWVPEKIAASFLIRMFQLFCATTKLRMKWVRQVHLLPIRRSRGRKTPRPKEMQKSQRKIDDGEALKQRLP